MMETGSIFWSMVFGSIGSGYFIYGKKQQHLMALISGVALCLVPYFVSGALSMVLLSLGLMALPFVIRLDQ